ncbi:MAG: CpaF family protein [Acidimicrobiales bacterium]
MLRDLPSPTLTPDRLHQLLVDARGVEHSDEPLRQEVERRARAEAPLLGGSELTEMIDSVLARVQGLGSLERLLEDPTITEIMVNGPNQVWIERHGQLERVTLSSPLDAGSIEQLIERVVAPLGLRIDRSSPLVDARLPDGSRVNAVVPPLAVDGPCLTIRRFGTRRIPLGEFCHPEVEELLSWAVRTRRNIIVSGGTGAGKTTLLNALAAQITEGERIITVEDTAELQLPGAHVVRLEARPPNAEGAGEVSVRELVRNALRMRPDRIVVGEVRGPEALDMLQAMNTGHEGSLSTCHANGASDALRRIETMVLTGAVVLPLAAIRDQMTSALDLVIQVARRPDGSRSVIEVAEVCFEAPGNDPCRVRRLAGSVGLEALPERVNRGEQDDKFELGRQP